jgi:hypothetical protein
MAGARRPARRPGEHRHLRYWIEIAAPYPARLNSLRVAFQ